MIGNTDCSAATVQRMKMVLAVSAARKSGFAGATIASNSDRAAELGMNSEVAATAVSNWQDAFAAASAGRNSAAEEIAEELAAHTRWVVEAKAENNLQAVVVATDDCTQRAVEARTVRTESAAAGTIASNLAAFEGKSVSRGNAAAAEKLADNWRPPEERAENN